MPGAWCQSSFTRTVPEFITHLLCNLNSSRTVPQFDYTIAPKTDSIIVALDSDIRGATSCPSISKPNPRQLGSSGRRNIGGVARRPILLMRPWEKSVSVHFLSDVVCFPN